MHITCETKRCLLGDEFQCHPVRQEHWSFTLTIFLVQKLSKTFYSPAVNNFFPNTLHATYQKYFNFSFWMSKKSHLYNKQNLKMLERMQRRFGFSWRPCGVDRVNIDHVWCEPQWHGRLGDKRERTHHLSHSSTKGSLDSN